MSTDVDTHLQLRQLEVGTPEGVLPVEQQLIVVHLLRALHIELSGLRHGYQNEQQPVKAEGPQCGAARVDPRKVCLSAVSGPGLMSRNQLLRLPWKMLRFAEV